MLKPTLAQLIHICTHLEADQVREHAALMWGDFDPEALAWEFYRNDGIAHVFTHAGRPYMAAGFRFLWQGVVQSWAVSTSEREGHDLEITRTSRKVMLGLFASGTRRIQCLCMEDRHAAQAWYRTLGLAKEATFKGYGRNGENFCLYTRHGENADVR